MSDLKGNNKLSKSTFISFAKSLQAQTDFFGSGFTYCCCSKYYHYGFFKITIANGLISGYIPNILDEASELNL